jgi:hypothetical protein
MSFQSGDRVTEIASENVVPHVVLTVDGEQLTLARELLDGSRGVEGVRSALAFRPMTTADDNAYLAQAEKNLAENRARIVRLQRGAETFAANLDAAKRLHLARQLTPVKP